MSWSVNVSTTVTVPVSARYIDEFLRLKCAPDLLRFFNKCQHPAKEVTETFAAFRMVRKQLGSENFGRNDFTCIVPGDGALPRTGATMAHLTRWEIISVDPALKEEGENAFGVERLQCIKKRIQDCRLYSRPNLVVLAVHSHAPLQAALDIASNWKEALVIAIPCCVPQAIQDREEYLKCKMSSTQDMGIFSQKNEVLTWKIIRASR
ncbi:MAG: hypothetical protein DRN26_02895 [Thermoplasmata archaeon]|nr:MAG: hypothetical protein DRN26_02895 [Thermoplasmata archaeon]